MTEFSAKEFRDTFITAGKRVVRKKGVHQVDPDKVLTEDQIIRKYGYDPDKSIFIRGEVPSSKRGWRIFAKAASTARTKWKLNGRPVVPFVTPSAVTEAYRKGVGKEYKRRVMEWKKIITGRPLPLYVEFFFIRRTKGTWDYNNLSEQPQDLMTDHGWIEDDNVKNMFPVPPSPPGYAVDPNNAGVIITLSTIYDNNRTSPKSHK